MQAVKALYKQGKIQLLEPLQGITEADLLVIVLDKKEQPANSQQPTDSTQHSALSTQHLIGSEQDFKSLGLASFFDTNEDNNVDWEDMFDVKSR